VKLECKAGTTIIEALAEITGNSFKSALTGLTSGLFGITPSGLIKSAFSIVAVLVCVAVLLLFLFKKKPGNENNVEEHDDIIGDANPEMRFIKSNEAPWLH
jgi:hypothetical protein